MGLEEALEVIKKAYRCDTNEDENYCAKFPVSDGSLCKGCPYDTTVKKRLEAMQIILKAHGKEVQ